MKKEWTNGFRRRAEIDVGKEVSNELIARLKRELRL